MSTVAMAMIADQHYMAHALALGRRSLARTWPNPSVGCIIVAGNGPARRIVGRGWTAPGGRPHAETIALVQAGAAAQGACAYVTLEPCCHTGQTPPCTDALIAAGVARVVTALADPDARVAGRGHGALEAAGIAVETGLCEADARIDHAGFLSRIERGRPHVHLKLAVSADHKIASAARDVVHVTGDEARRRGHLLRAENDAIMIGSGTVRDDDPHLTCRLPGLEDRSPVRVVLDSAAGLAVDSALVRTLEVAPVWLICTGTAPAQNRRCLEQAGVIVVTVRPGDDGRPDIAAALEELASRGITRLLVEGGAQVAAALVERDLADQVTLFCSALELGPDGLDALGPLPLETVTANARFRLLDTLPVGADTMMCYRKEE